MAHSRFQSGFVRSLLAYFEMALEAHHFYAESLPNPQMFKELLARRAMLLLFDGLDEVTTLYERLELVNEIEHFALQYPGNRVLVTSRPVGYELAPISHPLFQCAEVQNFDNEQIEQFLNNWYTAVLRLSPIPQQEQEEMNLLLETVKRNVRLRKLAENPLLLTVITALHRYERLPDRRVQIYDRCAYLLLETWAKLRGTHERWKDMKMIKEDQYICVARLGFVLHERSQENIDKGEENETVDLPSRFFRESVEAFLKEQNLIVDKAERRTEAKRFISLVQEEAGLIVERGMDRNGEALYSFVHRTFQEYFAAIDIYERYQQQMDLKIISDFLSTNLHNPHWHEVILLLLSKLRSNPVTSLLKQILEGQIKSRRSQYTEILQQDLFFICDCLVEEIKVESILVDMVASRLSYVVKEGYFSSLRKEALSYLGKLIQTRQYTEQGKKELIAFVTQDNDLDIATKLEVIYALYLYDNKFYKIQQKISSILQVLLQRSDLPVKLVWQTTLSLYGSSIEGSQANQLAITMFQALLQRPDLPIGLTWQTTLSLYRSGSQELKAQQLVISTFETLLQRPDLPIKQILQTAEAFYGSGTEGSEPRQLAVLIFKALLQRADLPIEQIWRTAEAFYRSSAEESEDQELAISMLETLIQRMDLSIEQAWDTAISLYHNQNPEESKAQRLVMFIFETLLQRSELPVEQVWQTAEILFRNSIEESKIRQLAISMLETLLKYEDLSTEQSWQIVEALYSNSNEGSDARRLAASIMIRLLLDTNDTENRRDIYYMLRAMIREFHELPVVEKRKGGSKRRCL